MANTFDRELTSSQETLAAYYALYDIIYYGDKHKQGGIKSVSDIKLVLKQYIKELDNLSKEERDDFKPVYEKALHIASQYSEYDFQQLKEKVKEEGSSLTE